MILTIYTYDIYIFFVGLVHRNDSLWKVQQDLLLEGNSFELSEVAEAELTMRKHNEGHIHFELQLTSNELHEPLELLFVRLDF